MDVDPPEAAIFLRFLLCFIKEIFYRIFRSAARGEGGQNARGGGAQLLDNFLDFTHFPFIHAGTFGAGEDALVGAPATGAVAVVHLVLADVAALGGDGEDE